MTNKTVANFETQIAQINLPHQFVALVFENLLLQFVAFGYGINFPKMQFIIHPFRLPLDESVKDFRTA
jgi:hypothetical protein